MKTIIRHTRGNRIELVLPLSKMKVTSTDGNVTRDDEPLMPHDNIVVRLYRGGLACYEITPIVNGNFMRVVDDGTILSGKYALEVVCKDSQGRPMRYKKLSDPVIEVTEYTADGGVYDTNEFNVLTYYPIIKGRVSAILIEEDGVSIVEGGNFGGDEDATDNFADVTAIFGEGNVEVDDEYVTLNI